MALGVFIEEEDFYRLKSVRGVLEVLEHIDGDFQNRTAVSLNGVASVLSYAYLDMREVLEGKQVKHYPDIKFTDEDEDEDEAAEATPAPLPAQCEHVRVRCGDAANDETAALPPDAVGFQLDMSPDFSSILKQISQVHHLPLPRFAWLVRQMNALDLESITMGEFLALLRRAHRVPIVVA